MVTVRYFAAARAAAGVAQEVVPAAGSRDELVAALTARHGERLGAVLRACSFLVDGVSWREGTRPVPAGGTVDVLPPFAGG